MDSTTRPCPHVTLKSIANNPEIREGMTREQIDAAIARYAEQETLYDQPYTDKSRVRVTGPFTVEAVPAPTVRSLEDIEIGTIELDRHRVRFSSRWLIFVTQRRPCLTPLSRALGQHCGTRNGATNC